MKAQFGKTVRESNVCVLCGERPATTAEHVPPKSLFLALPSPYLTVPACMLCNNSTKLEDEYLRETMSGTSLVGQGLKVWSEKVKPKLKTHPKTLSRLAKGAAIRLVETHLGQLSMPTLAIDANRVTKSVVKMARGLYWFHTGALMAPDLDFTVGLFDAARWPAYADAPESRNLLAMTTMGVYRDPEVMKTFFYTYATLGPGSLWYFFFYKQNVIVVVALPPGMHPPPTPAPKES